MPLPPDPNWGGLGALPLPYDPRDYSILLHPGVAQALHAGATGPIDLSSAIGGVLNQGAEGACVAFSTASLCALDEALAGKPWPLLDAENLYRRNGGTGANGIDSRQCLQDVVTNGVNRVGGGAPPVKEASYLFVPKQAGLFRDTLMAALNARKPCVVATLLPQQFGWTSSGDPTSGYHQMLLCGGDDFWAIFQNTWGPSWGNNGKARIPWSYLDPTRWDVFAYTVDPLDVPTPPPPPPPPPGVKTVTGTIGGTGLQILAVGGRYALKAAGLDAELTLTSIEGGPGPTPPPPPPPPPGDLVVSVASGGHHLLSAVVRDAAGHYRSANCIAVTAAGQVLGGRQTTPAGATAIPAVWVTNGLLPGTPVTVSATTGDRRTGAGQGTTS